jgi:hypothetical protein
MSSERHLEGEEGLYIQDTTWVFGSYHHPDDPPRTYRIREQLPLGERIETRSTTITRKWVRLRYAEDDVPGVPNRPDRQEAYSFLATIRYSKNRRYHQEYRVERDLAGMRACES